MMPEDKVGLGSDEITSSAEEYRKTALVVDICNYVRTKTEKSELSLGDVIIYLYAELRKRTNDEISYEKFQEILLNAKKEDAL